MAALLTRIEALEGETQHLRDDLQQANTELATARSQLAESKVTLETPLQEQTSHFVARETAVKDELRQLVSVEGSSLEHLSRRIRANNVVMHGVPDNATTSRPADLTRLVKGRLDDAAPRRGPTPAPFQSIQAVSHIGRPGSNKSPVLVEFFTHTAKHEAFKLSPQLRRARCRPSRRSCGESLKASCLAVWVENSTNTRRAHSQAVEGPEGLGSGLLCRQAEGFQSLLSACSAPLQGSGHQQNMQEGGGNSSVCPFQTPQGHLLGPLALFLSLRPLLLPMVA